MSEQKQNNQSSGGFRTSIGGQALIEGIYMRGPDKQSTPFKNRQMRPFPRPQTRHLRPGTFSG